MLTLLNSLSTRIVQSASQIRLFHGIFYAIGSIVQSLFPMAFITRSLPLNLDILLLGEVEPPGWDREMLDRDLGLEHMHKNIH